LNLQPFTQGGLIGALGQSNQLGEHLVLTQNRSMSAREVAPEAKPGMICNIRKIGEKPEVSQFPT